jgi:hypothetical protein
VLGYKRAKTEREACEDRELAGRLQPRREEVAILELPLERKQGGTTAQKKAAGRKGGKAAAPKS